MNTITKLYEAATRHIEDEEGAAMVEYGLLIFFIALVVMAVLALLGPQIEQMFQQVVNGISAANAG